MSGSVASTDDAANPADSNVIAASARVAFENEIAGPMRRIMVRIVCAKEDSFAMRGNCDPPWRVSQTATELRTGVEPAIFNYFGRSI